VDSAKFAYICPYTYLNSFDFLLCRW